MAIIGLFWLPFVDQFVRERITGFAFHDVRFCFFVGERNGGDLGPDEKRNIETVVLDAEGRLEFCRVLLTMSVPKSIQRMVTVPKGNGMSAMMKRRKGEISGMLDVSV